MNNVYFDNVVEVGRLYLDYIFYEFEDEPILFLCSDVNKDLYICLCSDIRYEQKWVITKCNFTTLKSLIGEETDIASVFLTSKKLIIITMDLQGNENSYTIGVEEIDRLDLPKENTFIRCNKIKALDYLWRKELDILYSQLKETFNPTPVWSDIIKTYDTVLKESISITNKQIDIYSNSISKNFVLLLDNSVDLWREAMITKLQYSFNTEDKYNKPIDNIDVDDANNENYLGAA